MQSVFSASWYRVAQLKPRLRSQAYVSRHTYRGELWYVLQDLASGRFLRLNPQAYRIVALMDGVRNLDEIWEHACQNFGDNTPTQDEVLHLLSQLHQANVLLTDQIPDLGELDVRGKKLRKMKLKQYISNPMSLKIPLVDPDRLLTFLVGNISRGWYKWLLVIWALILLLGIIQGALNWDALTQDITSRIFTPENLLLMWLVFPLLKAFHELGHGIAIKMFGGQCHEMGIMFLVLMPIPYVDASHASALPSKHERMIIGLAGMMIELFLASIAIWFWLAAEPGMMKAFFYQVIILAGITTILFNANPLLRFDGYYIFADWLEIPNLGQKSNSYIGYLINRYLFGAREAVSRPHMTAREPGWLAGYSISAFIYRMIVATAIILLVADFFFFVGIILALWATYVMLLAPLFKNLRYLMTSPGLDGYRQRAYFVSGSIISVLFGFLLLIPMPSATMTEGVIWMPEQSQIRAPNQCFAEKILGIPGQHVQAGQILLSCSDPELEINLVQLKARLEELEARHALAVTTDKVAAQIIRSEWEHSQDKLLVAQTRKKDLTFKSPYQGIFVMNAPEDFPGKYLERGELIAYVLDPQRYSLIAIVPQGRVDLVRNNIRKVDLRTVDNISRLLPAKISRQVPAATKQLPSMALALEGGGNIGMKPGGSPGDQPEAIVSLFQFEVGFLANEAPTFLGNRVYVRFEHEPEVLAKQWYRNLRQLFLKRFAV